MHTEVILGFGLVVGLITGSMLLWPIQTDDAALLVGFLAVYSAGSMVLLRSEKRALRNNDNLRRMTTESAEAVQSSVTSGVYTLRQQTQAAVREIAGHLRADQESIQSVLGEEFGNIRESLSSVSVAQTAQREYLKAQLTELGMAFDSSLLDNRRSAEDHHAELQKSAAEQTAAIRSGAEAHSNRLDRITDSLAWTHAALSDTKSELTESLDELSRRGDTIDVALSGVRQELLDQVVSLQSTIDETKAQLVSSSQEALNQLSTRSEASEAALSRMRQTLADETEALREAIDETKAQLVSSSQETLNQLSTRSEASEAAEQRLTSGYLEQAAIIKEHVGAGLARALKAIEAESRETKVRLSELSDEVPLQLSAEINNVFDGLKTRAEGDAARIDKQYEDIKSRQARSREQLEESDRLMRQRHDQLVDVTKVILRLANLMNMKESWQSMVLRQTLQVPTVSKGFDLADLNADEEMISVVNSITDDVERRMTGRYAGSRSTRQAHMIPTWVTALAAPDEPDYAHVEIGALFGGSLVSRLKILERIGRTGQSVIAIDPLDGYYGQQVDPVTGLPVDEATVRENLEKFDCVMDNMVLIKGLSTSDEVVETVRQYKVLSLFIDGDHSYEVVKSDWEKYSPFVIPGGYVIFDDYGTFTWPGVIRFVNEALENRMVDGWQVHGLFGDALLMQRKQ